MTIAVGVGMGLAAMLFVRRSITLTSIIRMEKDHEAYGELPSQVAVYDINGSLLFGSAQKSDENHFDSDAGYPGGHPRYVRSQYAGCERNRGHGVHREQPC